MATHASGTRTAATAERTTDLAPVRDGRLVPYGVIVLGGLGAGLLVGEPTLGVMTVPFVLALVLGLRRTGDVRVTARITLDAEQLVEDDIVRGTLELTWDGVYDAEVMLYRLRGVAPMEPDAIAWSLPAAAGRIELPIELRAAQWGRHAACEVWVRLELPFGLLAWTGRLVTGPVIRVLPERERLNRLLDPAHSRAVLGAHRTRRVGDAGEFTELRPYAPGDRLRDLNWRATARRGQPFVNRYNPDLSGDVVIVVDALADGSVSSMHALARAARAAWALASIHLRANDRVGLAGLGGRTEWLAPASGRIAKYKLLETLLRIGGAATDSSSARRVHNVAVPPAALIIAITPLHDPLTLRALEAWRARGRSVAVVMIEIEDLLDEPESAAEVLARRVWRLDLDLRRRELARLGVPVVSAPARGPIGPVVSALRRAHRTPALRTRR